mgnify:CR=1 FL=1
MRHDIGQVLAAQSLGRGGVHRQHRRVPQCFIKRQLQPDERSARSTAIGDEKLVQSSSFHELRSRPVRAHCLDNASDVVIIQSALAYSGVEHGKPKLFGAKTAARLSISLRQLQKVGQAQIRCQMVQNHADRQFLHRRKLLNSNLQRGRVRKSSLQRLF